MANLNSPTEHGGEINTEFFSPFLKHHFFSAFIFPIILIIPILPILVPEKN